MRRGERHQIRPMAGPYPSLSSTIVEIDIPDDVEDKLRVKHGVSPREVRQVLTSSDALWLQDPERPANEWCVLGPTKKGRWLRIHGCIYEAKPRDGHFRVFTAFDMTTAWHLLYRTYKQQLTGR